MNPNACRDADRVIWFATGSEVASFYETFVDSPAGLEMIQKHNAKLQNLRKRIQSYNWKRD
jgi:hypothetical protein